MGGIWLYAGLDVGIVKSPDCFCGWDRLANDGLPDKRRVYSLAADPQNPSTLYAGLRAGVFKTADGGKSLRQVSNEVSDAIVARSEGPRVGKGCSVLVELGGGAIIKKKKKIKT